MLRFLSLLPVLLATCAATKASADIITTTLTLSPATSEFNTLALTLGSTANSTLTGSFDATFDIDPITGVVSSLTLVTTPQTPTISGSNFVLPGLITVTGLGSTVTTTNPAVMSGSFPGANHGIIFNSGIVTGAATANFSTDPLGIDGGGTGTVTATAVGPSLFDIVLTLPISDAVDVGGGSLAITGNLRAVGQINAIPEPGSGMLLCSLGFLGLLLPRRKRLVAPAV